MSGLWQKRLLAAGFSAEAAAASALSYARVETAMASLGGPIDGAVAWWVPGRIEVLGKHTDYGGGRSVVCAVERGLHLLVRPRQDALVQVVDANSGVSWHDTLHPDLTPVPGQWLNYPLTAVRRLARDFPGEHRGMDLVFLSTIPRAAGLSSSSALVVATALALADVNALRDHPVWRAALPDDASLAGYLGAVENGLAFGPLPVDFGVGTHGGSEDHTAILCSTADHLGTFHYLPVTAEALVTLPPEWSFVIASSGVAASKTGAVREHYNALSAQLARLRALWSELAERSAPSLHALVREAPATLPALRERLADEPDGTVLLRRLDQFIEECDVLIPDLLAAVATRDSDRLGRVTDRSQHLAEVVLANQIAETRSLVREARALGALGASAFGAGFGGSVWALVETARADRFLTEWQTGYRTAFPAHTARSDFFRTRPGPGARRIPR